MYYFWLCGGFSLIVVSGGYSSLRCIGLLPRWLLFQGTGSRHVDSVVLAQAQLLRLMGESSWTRDRTHSPALAGKFLTTSLDFF